jgi:hypothetical protein
MDSQKQDIMAVSLVHGRLIGRSRQVPEVKSTGRHG